MLNELSQLGKLLMAMQQVYLNQFEECPDKMSPIATNALN